MRELAFNELDIITGGETSTAEKVEDVFTVLTWAGGAVAVVAGIFGAPVTASVAAISAIVTGAGAIGANLYQDYDWFQISFDGFLDQSANCYTGNLPFGPVPTIMYCNY